MIAKYRNTSKHPELIENYDKAITDDKLWICHHRLETHFSDGTPRPVNAFLYKNELIALDMYFNRPSEELIFMTVRDHRILHNKDILTRTKIAVSNIGKKHTGSLNWYNNGKINKRGSKCPRGFVPGRIINILL